MKGYIHSLETMGLVDGPGVRSVVFLAGCPLRCLYCHNPDSWQKVGREMEAEELANRLLRFQTYYTRSGGGVTFSGGEPLCQKEFLEETLIRLRKRGVHTCLDTAGSVPGDFGSVLENTDLILYDVKQYDRMEYLRITGKEMDTTLDFVEQVRRTEVPMWVRHVVVPGLTDSRAHMEGLRSYIDTLPNVKRVELLPFHKLGAHKYKKLGLDDPLSQTKPMSQERCKALEVQYFGDYRKESHSA